MDMVLTRNWVDEVPVGKSLGRDFGFRVWRWR